MPFFSVNSHLIDVLNYLKGLKPRAISRKHYKYDYSGPLFLELREENKKLFQLLLKNNAYLLKRKGICLFQQIREIEPLGFKINYNQIRNLRKGVRISNSLNYLMVFCKYWGLGLVDMIGYDMEERDILMDNNRE